MGNEIWIYTEIGKLNPGELCSQSSTRDIRSRSSSVVESSPSIREAWVQISATPTKSLKTLCLLLGSMVPQLANLNSLSVKHGLL